MVGMIYVGDHPTLLSLSCGPRGYSIEYFFKNLHYKSNQAIDPQGRDKFAPKRLVCTIYVRYHWTLLCILNI